MRHPPVHFALHVHAPSTSECNSNEILNSVHFLRCFSQVSVFIARELNPFMVYMISFWQWMIQPGIICDWTWLLPGCRPCSDWYCFIYFVCAMRQSMMHGPAVYVADWCNKVVTAHWHYTEPLSAWTESR